MKASLPLKTAVLIAYVAACTHLLVLAHEVDTLYVTDVADTTALRLRAEGLVQ